MDCLDRQGRFESRLDAAVQPQSRQLELLFRAGMRLVFYALVYLLGFAFAYVLILYLLT